MKFWMTVCPRLQGGDSSVGCYRASLGHKAQHSFDNNAVFRGLWHPRFGSVMSVVATRDIRRGQEVMVDYSYPLSSCPGWYSKLWEKHIDKG